MFLFAWALSRFEEAGSTVNIGLCMTIINSQSNDLSDKKAGLLPSMLKIGVTSLTVAAVLYPLERSIIRLQASGGPGILGATAAPFMFSYKTVLKIFSSHLRDFSTAAKGSFMKNTVIANKEDITEKIDK